MSSEQSVKELSFISFYLFSHISCNCCTILDRDLDEDKVGHKIDDGKEKKEEDENDLEVSDEDVDGKNDYGEEGRPKNTNEEMPNNLIFFKGVVDSNDLLLLNINRETLQESKTIKVIYKKLVRKEIEMMCKLAEKDKSKKEEDYDTDDDTKEVEINKKREVVDTDNDKIVIDAAGINDNFIIVRIYIDDTSRSEVSSMETHR